MIPDITAISIEHDSNRRIPLDIPNGDSVKFRLKFAASPKLLPIRCSKIENVI
jgi:hypothetical protein